jgi:hypothetical protein
VVTVGFYQQLVLSVDFCHGTSYISRCFIPWIQCGKLTSVGLESMQVMEAWVFPGDLPGTQDMMSCIKALGAVSSRALFVLPKACKRSCSSP